MDTRVIKDADIKSKVKFDYWGRLEEAMASEATKNVTPEAIEVIWWPQMHGSMKIVLSLASL